MSTAEEIPKHRKAGKRKPFKVRWYWDGDRLDPRNRNMLKAEYRSRFVTERAASQAMADWKAGRGTIGGYIGKEADGWKCELIKS